MTVVARRRASRLPWIVVAAAAVLAPLGATAARADPSPSPTPTPALPLAVELRGISPLAPQPGQTLTVRGRLTNVSTETVSQLQVRLLVSRSTVGSRGQFDDYAATPDGAPPPDAIAANTAQVSSLRTSLPPGATTGFRIDVPVDDLHLPVGWNVYEMAVTATGATTVGVNTVGQIRTFLPWAPVGELGTGAPTPVAWIWPLVDRPHRTTATQWTDDDLAAALRPGGRLAVLLDAAARAQTQRQPPPRKPPRRRKHHKPVPVAPPRPVITAVPVTWAVDPMLVQDAQAMDAGYKVGPPGDRHPGTGQTAARIWLSDLQAAVRHGEVLGLPYADPDLVAAIRNDLTTDAQRAAKIGQALLAHALPTASLPYAWPVGGFADQRSLDTLFTEGVTTVVLDSTALPVTGGDQSLTPGAHASVTTRDGTMDAILADHRLSTAVDDAARTPALATLTTQRVLSELLMIQAERPHLPRAVVIAPDRRWAPTAALATGLLSGTGRVPWIQPVPLTQVVSSPVYDLVQRPLVSYPSDAHAGELRRSYLRSTVALTNRLDAFATVAGDTQAGQFDDDLLRLFSSAWRTDPAGASAARTKLNGVLTRTMQKVRIATQPDSLITLTGSSGTVPVTVSNELDTAVRVTVVASADPHLEVRRGRRVTLTIRAHTQLPVDIRVSARTRGVATLTVQLYTWGIGARPYSAPVQLRINSTAYGLEAVLITGGATAVLLVGAGVRLGRRARAARRATRAAT